MCTHSPTHWNVPRRFHTLMPIIHEIYTKYCTDRYFHNLYSHSYVWTCTHICIHAHLRVTHIHMHDVHTQTSIHVYEKNYAFAWNTPHTCTHMDKLLHIYTYIHSDAVHWQSLSLSLTHAHAHGIFFRIWLTFNPFALLIALRGLRTLRTRRIFTTEIALDLEDNKGNSSD